MKTAGWIELRATGPGIWTDAAAAILVEAGSPGVVDEDTTLPPELIISHGSPKETSRKKSKNAKAALRAYFQGSSGKNRELLDSIAASLGRIGWRFTFAPYREVDWREKWKAGIKPIRIRCARTSLVVKPTWRKIKKQKSDIVIEIDPGMAFGTGSHETTRTCLKAIIETIKEKPADAGKIRFLDVGTGSGVLAIAAVKLGVKSAVGIDIDPEAVAVARKNIKLNKTPVRLSDALLESIKGTYEIVVANIISRELKMLAMQLASKTARDGKLILSGILTEEAGRIIKTFCANGLALQKEYILGEWATLVFIRI